MNILLLTENKANSTLPKFIKPLQPAMHFGLEALLYSFIFQLNLASSIQNAFGLIKSDNVEFTFCLNI